MDKMKISYGRGLYKRQEAGKETVYAGEMVLDDVKICIDGKPDSFILLDRIEEIRKKRGRIEIYVISSGAFAYKVLMQGKGIERLLDDLLAVRNFRRVWINKWKAKDFWKELR